MAYNKATAYGDSQNILESEVGLVVKTRQATKSMASDAGSKKIIKAGTLYTNPSDGTDIGVFLSDYDMTDYEAVPAAVVFQGRVKKDLLDSAAQAKAADFKAKGLYLV